MAVVETGPIGPRFFFSAEKGVDHLADVPLFSEQDCSLRHKEKRHDPQDHDPRPGAFRGWRD